MRKNMFYYVKRFGSFTLSQLPFNEVDALILSELSYMDFCGLVHTIREDMEPVDFLSLNSENLLKQMTANTLAEPDNAKLMKMMFETERYKNMKLNFYRSRFDADLELQFSAIVFIFEECNFVAFRGTDATIIGWKEDFNMSFLDVVPSQKQCLLYLEKIAHKLTGKLYLGGHSKGGNLACFAGIYTQKSIQDRIEKIYDFDGPGFKYDIFDSPNYKRVEHKIKKYVTRDSMIGVIMHFVENYEVVRCYGVSLMQHAPFRWMVTDEGKLDTTETTSFNCKVFARAVKDWMLCYTDEERSKVIDIWFDLLSASEKSTVIEFKWQVLRCIKMIRKRYKQLDPETVVYLKKTMRQYWNIYFYNRELMKDERKRARKMGRKY